MMKASNFTLFQLYIVLLILVTRTTAGKVPQSIEETSENYHDQQDPSLSLTHHRHPTTIDDSKQAAFHNDDNDNDPNSSDSDEKYINDPPHQWSDLANKHYPQKFIRTSDGANNGGDSRLWAIPYRFGKRSAMPYRFGKRAGMHFRLGKKSASL